MNVCKFSREIQIAKTDPIRERKFKLTSFYRRNRITKELPYKRGPGLKIVSQEILPNLQRPDNSNTV